ncbi:short-chain dehydrogenase [Coxiella burnetii]|uniref:SDR family oxidoreductase n=1 Tax=Coxiella burnetii TaxID=777 RepID=UPI0002F73979|nr:SDR family oxidoreductase [Coxiella burnetii]AML48148.1 short-chain dehydrogenase [Coxiella burnetii]AML54167.1 short-chain dehydrogenase [Coxiella burnetii]ATN68130.1 short-chain dehydrogenase [Coxiella burnetii]ATN70059.1 short-chain dehydrogenase [Coxiella burnetii]ATN72008.1 short-chain dehydrogenase [Coxiella burnetii]
MKYFNQNEWALILGGSSGFGLASAKQLAARGMNIFIVHRDRRGAMEKINQAFNEIKSYGVQFQACNTDALSPEGRAEVLGQLQSIRGAQSKVKLLLHSIAFGNLKPIAPEKSLEETHNGAIEEFATALGVLPDTLKEKLEHHAEQLPQLTLLQSPQYSQSLIEQEDMANTIYSMGTSLLTWTQAIHQAGLFDEDARVIGLTSEGNEIAWKGYAAVSAAKAALEAVSRSIAVEFAAYSIRSNLLQPGVTDTPALRLIPGSNRLKAVAKMKNPFKRLTRPEDVANAVVLLAMPESGWINGTIIRVDGGERIGSI